MRNRKLTTLLSIAGSDPLGGAGIQTDIKCGSVLGLHVVTAITSVTVQNSKAFSEINPVPSHLLSSQLDAIFEDVIPTAIKIGLVGSTDNIKVIARVIEKYPDIPVVIDPVLLPTKYHGNIDDFNKIIAYYRKYLFPLATVITPNFLEVKKFFNVKNWNELNLRNTLQEFHIKSLVITGLNSKEREIKDLLLTDNSAVIISHKKYDCINLHGTGCAFSSFMASFLAKGMSLKKSFIHTVLKMDKILSKSSFYSLGSSTYGPLNINDYKY